MIELFEFLKQCEYHKNDKFIFINFRDADELFKFIGNEFEEEALDCWINSGCIIFKVDDLINVINEEWTEEIIEALNKEVE